MRDSQPKCSGLDSQCLSLMPKRPKLPYLHLDFINPKNMSSLISHLAMILMRVEWNIYCGSSVLVQPSNLSSVYFTLQFFILNRHCVTSVCVCLCTVFCGHGGTYGTHGPAQQDLGGADGVGGRDVGAGDGAVRVGGAGGGHLVGLGGHAGGALAVHVQRHHAELEAGACGRHRSTGEQTLGWFVILGCICVFSVKLLA